MTFFEACSNTDEQKNEKEPRLGAKPTIQCQAEPDADADGKSNRYPQAGDIARFL